MTENAAQSPSAANVQDILMGWREGHPVLDSLAHEQEVVADAFDELCGDLDVARTPHVLGHDVRVDVLTEAFRLAVRAFAQYAQDTNEVTDDEIAGFAAGFLQDAEWRVKRFPA